MSVARQPAPSVQCDLCGSIMAMPDHCRDSGTILGLLVCSQCVEDQLAALQLETQP